MSWWIVTMGVVVAGAGVKRWLIDIAFSRTAPIGANALFHQTVLMIGLLQSNKKKWFITAFNGFEVYYFKVNAVVLKYNADIRLHA